MSEKYNIFLLNVEELKFDVAENGNMCLKTVLSNVLGYIPSLRLFLIMTVEQNLILQ